MHAIYGRGFTDSGADDGAGGCPRCDITTKRFRSLVRLRSAHGTPLANSAPTDRRTHIGRSGRRQRPDRGMLVRLILRPREVSLAAVTRFSTRP
jgi:hypothetical protein